MCGIALIGTNLGMLFLDSIPTLLMMPLVRGVASIYFPILMIMVYQLPGIRPREVAVGVALMLVSYWIGAAVGPIVVGLVQENTGNLRFALYTTAFTPMIMVVAAVIIQMQQSEASIRAT